MIVLLDKKICFIHIYKTSGTSLTKLLRNNNILYNKKLKEEDIPEKLDIGWQKIFHFDYKQHDNLSVSIEKMKEYNICFNKFNFFTICRNPYDWIGSIWFNKFCRKWINNKEIIDLHSYPFSKYLKEVYSRKIIVWMENLNTQYSFIKNDKGIKVKIFKFENVNTLNEIIKYYDLNNKDIPLCGQTNNNDSVKKRFINYNYSLEDIEIVNNLLHEDFIFFGYTKYHKLEDFNKNFLS